MSVCVSPELQLPWRTSAPPSSVSISPLIGPRCAGPVRAPLRVPACVRVRARVRWREAQSDRRIISISIQINNSTLRERASPCARPPRLRGSRLRALRHFALLFLNVVALEEWWWILTERADHGQCRRIMSYVSSQGKSHHRSSDRLRSPIDTASRWPPDDWQLSHTLSSSDAAIDHQPG